MHFIEIPHAIKQLMLFMSRHREGLVNGACLLGGPIAGQRVERLIDALSFSRPQMTRWIGRELVVLHRLLSLQDVANFDRPEAHFFSLIDPADPVVADLCLLTDGLTDCLRDLVAADLLADDDLDLAA